MRRPLFLLALVLAIVLGGQLSGAGPLRAAQNRPVAPIDREARLIAALNDCLQERFRDVDERFGIRRMITIESPHRFKPENVRELAAVDELERARLRLVLYLAGRRVLRVKTEAVVAGGGSLWAFIKGPVLVTPVDPTRTAADDVVGHAPPEPALLLDESRRALVAFKGTDSHDFVVGQWKFVARPVRAREECLNCHRDEFVTVSPSSNPSGTPLRIGDALGAVIYGYQPRK